MESSVSASLHPLPHITGYTVIERLYLGSRTAVYRAVQMADLRSVVLKVLQREYPSFGELVQFRNQYAITKHLAIPGIVQPLSLEPLGNSYALIMEDWGGISLSQYLQRQPLAVAEVLTIALSLADILHLLHQQRVIHKDIKPTNILIHPEFKQIKLIDFSIASLLPKETQEIQNPNTLEGTLAYLAPEQTGRMNRGIDYRADYYAFGVTLYELLTGQLPFTTKDPLELVHCHIARAATPVHQVNPTVPEPISAIVAKLMAKNAEDRYQSALGLKHDLEQCLTQWQTTGAIAEFELGQRDLSDRFNIPEKLYGREAEVQALLAAFDRVAAGSAEIMLVAGFSGIGKTAVVNEVHKPILKQRGYFIKGKFDQFNRNVPLSAVVQALRDLMGQLLSESDSQLQTWKTQILAALGESAQVMIEVIPELEQITGPQPAVPELSGTEVQSRFNRLLQQFIQVFTTPEHPLVMFLDDLQWADSASLRLIQLLMGESQAGHLLMIGAYRDNEVFPAHPLVVTLDKLKQAQTTVTTLSLVPLRQESLNRLVADTLSCSAELAQPLTNLVHQKTQGNPFFATQFLKALYHDQLITFNAEAGHWQCDITRVQEASLTDDVVEFMATQLQRLSESTQSLLKLAACIGNQFDLQSLEIVSGQSATEVAADLWPALQEGFVLPISETYKFFQSAEPESEWRDRSITVTYKFLHDRVQQAAYSLISPDQKQATHYQIGKLLLANLAIAERSDRVFDVVNQINIGKSLIQDADEKKQIAELNLKAGQKAKAAAAYEAAKTYSQTGIDLLDSHCWETAYRLLFDLHFNLAEAALMSGDFQLLEQTIATLLTCAHSSIDQAKIYVLKVDQYSLQGQFAEAIQAGLTGLQHLGIDIDQADLAQLANDEFAAVEASLQNRPIATLLDLPAAVDPEVRAAIALLIILQPPAYIVANFDLYSFVTFRAVRLSIEQGNTAESIKAYVSYGFLIGLMHGQYQRGVEFADLSLQLSAKLNDKFQQSRACFLASYAIQVWAKPIEGAAEISYQGFLAGLESGEIIHAGYNLYGNILNRLFQGQNLADIATDIDKFWLIGEKLQHDFLLSMLDACRFFVSALTQSLDDPEALVEAEQTWVERSEAAQSHTALGTYYILQMHRACLIQGFQSDLHYVTEAGKFLGGTAGFTTSAGYYYYSSLLLINHCATLPAAERDEGLQQIANNQAQLKIWSESCPENFLHKYLLVEAERSRLAGHYLDALQLYDRAIAEAKANQYLPEEALANELAAKFYLAWDKEKVAAGYMQEAYYSYAYWGAKAKVHDLEIRYASLLRPILQQATQPTTVLETLATLTAPNYSIHSADDSSRSSSTSVNVALDFAAILKASQSLSSTIKLVELLEQLTRIILQNSGGDRCALILPNPAGEWRVEAIATPDDTKLCSAVLEDHPQLPIKLIQYVKNVREVVVIDQLKTELPVLDDYLVQQQPKSVLCLPILNQGQLIGILCLENQFASNVFTRDRILILNFLCTQAAISLENARLYQNSQQALARIQQQEVQYRGIFETVSEGLAIISLETGRLVAANPAYCQMHGYSYEELLALEPQQLMRPSAYAKYNSFLKAVQHSQEFDCDAVCIKKDGTPFNAEIHSVPFWYSGQLCGLTVIRDVSQRRQLERTLQENNQALEKTLTELQQAQMHVIQSEKMSALGNLVAGVAHEINNPVGFLNGSLSNAKDYLQDLFAHLEIYQQHLPPTQPVQEHADTIDLAYLVEDLPKILQSMQGATNRIQSISNSLRTFSRADTEHKVSANLHEGLDSTLLILKYRLKANAHRPAIEILKQYDDLPAIACFPGQLNQVFMNILANAVDAFDEVALQTSFAELEANPQQITLQTTTLPAQNIVEIRIRDNGKGMTPAVKTRIFDHLFTTKMVGKGTGLGLAIARQIVVETHGGRLEVESVAGQGSEFLIQLPIQA
ncbi:MAG: AAA family ATPase [Almyronema sp.]